MSWRDQLQQASYKGAEFKVDSITDNEGPAIVFHDYPFGDFPTFEVMGERKHETQVRAYLVGDDYIQERDALISKLKEPTLGELVHERRGIIRCICDGRIRTAENRQLGIAYVDITFVEARESEFAPLSLAFTPEFLRNSIADALGIFAGDFALKWVPDLTAFVEEAATDLLGQFLNAADLISITAGLNPDDYVRLKRAVYVTAPTADLGSAVQDVILTAARSIPDPLKRLESLTPLLEFLESAPDVGLDPDTPTRRQQGTNQEAFKHYVQTVTLAGAAEAVADTIWPSYRPAVRYRDELNALISRLIYAVPESSAGAIRDIRLRVQADIRARTQTLPRLRQVELADTRPALDLSNELYGTGQRASEILELNDLKHPLFLPASSLITVPSE